MRTTRYFNEQVLRKRPYLKTEWIESVIRNPIRMETQSDGRVRLWGRVEGDRYLRVVLLADGETLHNAFLDRGFTEGVE